MENTDFIYPKADIGDRIVARLIDSVIIFIGCLLLVIPGLAYSFVMDGLGKGQSIGKKNRGLMVVNTTTNEPCTIGGSAIRQLVMMGLGAIPLIGWAIAIYHIYTSITNPHGIGLYDKLLHLQVIRKEDYENKNFVKGKVQ